MTQSTTSKKLTAGVDAKVGDRIAISGVQHTVTAVTGSELTVEETWEVRKRKPPKLVAHREHGHSWWPVRDVEPRHYRCARCGSTKEPKTRALESCNESVVRSVHER